MRLIRFGEKGRETPGLWKSGKIVDLRAIYPEIPDISEAFFRDGWLEKAAGIQEAGVEMDARIGCPILQLAKLICLGINYSEHKEETGLEKPAKARGHHRRVAGDHHDCHRLADGSTDAEHHSREYPGAGCGEGYAPDGLPLRGSHGE